MRTGFVFICMGRWGLSHIYRLNQNPLPCPAHPPTPVPRTPEVEVGIAEKPAGVRSEQDCDGELSVSLVESTTSAL